MSKKIIKKEARVKKAFRLDVARACAGTVFTKKNWTTLRADQEDEAERTSFLDVREVTNVPKKKEGTKPQTDGVVISAGAQKVIVMYGLDPEQREGAGALVPNEEGKINKPEADVAAKAFANEHMFDLDALALAVEFEIPIENLKGKGTGDDGWIIEADVDKLLT